jgi:hypothetical protein
VIGGFRVIGRRCVLQVGAGLVLGQGIQGQGIQGQGIQGQGLRPAAAELPVPPTRSLAFRMVRYGSEIGRHTLTFEPTGAALTVHVAVEALVTVLSIPLVHYSHRVVETWQGDQLTGLSSQTDKNGRMQWMNAHRTPQGLVVTGSQTEQYIAPEPAGCTSYWVKRMIDGPMISMEDGVLLRPVVTKHPGETVPLASGATIEADRYNLSGSFHIDLWYDRSNTWASLSTTVADGSSIRYERL